MIIKEWCPGSGDWAVDDEQWIEPGVYRCRGCDRPCNIPKAGHRVGLVPSHKRDVKQGTPTILRRGRYKVLALIFLKEHGPATASNIGAHLWCGSGKLDDPRPMRKPQAFARPAGLLLKRLEADNLVHCEFDGYHWMWSAR